MKLNGAPPKAFKYYRETKEQEEKIIMEDLYKSYSALIKKYEKEVMKEARLEPPNRNETIRDFRERQEGKILTEAFEEMAGYGFEKGYPEFLISLFYQKDISTYLNRLS